ncbi:MAG: radical SAM protein [Candidatus Latescibacterota bacterium]|nr:MAG: radical SAM protein [Candidatus Latescibacterota bacterium]
MKLLLINPKFPESFWSLKWAVDNFLPTKRTVNPPLGLATVAALCPHDWDVEIIDENVHTIPLRPDADIIGVCGMSVQYERQKELLSFFRRGGYYVVAGGSHASLCPEDYESCAHTVVSGEAEYIWPEFCRDFIAGTPKHFYRETGNVSLADSPVPRFDLLDLDKYKAVSVQFSRGCPYRCEFCDIIVMFGRKPRTKPLAQIESELDELRNHGVSSVFFVDDNLIGNKKCAKALLKMLAEYERKHRHGFVFGTEASINVASDEELLSLFRDANFKWLFIGIESPDAESLEETGKTQNLNRDMLASIRKIYSYGIDVLGGFIIGFDNDSADVFDKQNEFIEKSGILMSMIGLLTAIPKTPLYKRLKKEKRLIPSKAAADNSKLRTNFVPKRMTYRQMVDGYSSLHYRLFSDRSISTRVRNKVRHFTHPPLEIEFSLRQKLWLLQRFFVRGLLPGGFSRLFHFFRSCPWGKPKLIPVVISSWITGLSMRDYVNRHFVREFEGDGKRVRRQVARMKRVFGHRRHQGALGVTMREFAHKAAAVRISMNGRIQPVSLKSIGGHVEHLMQKTRSSVSIHIADFPKEQLELLTGLLKRLSKYGDRIHIHLDKPSRRIITVDSSVFNLGLRPE